MGFEGANVIFDTWVHPLVMGLEEHLLTMFREDFEFSDEAGASHHAAHSPRKATPEPVPFVSSEVGTQVEAPVSGLSTALETNGELAGSLWTAEAERELKKIPFFVRGKARRNTEAFAAADGRRQIDLDTLYDAKAHYAR
jgi:light-independent protochlorophyllide reductase subunit B